MKKRIIIAILLALGALAVAYWFLLRPAQPEQSPKPIESVKPDVVEQASDIIEPEVADDEMAILSEQFTPEEIENLRYNHSAAQAANQNVTFYGLCVDQDGNPIEGVHVRARLTKMRKSMLSVVATDSFKYYEELEAFTDSDGRFEFIDEGSYLLLEKVEKSGYLTARGPESFGFRFGQILIGNALAGTHQGNPLKPVTFILWKKGEGSAATEIRDRNGANADFGMQGGAIDKVTYFDLERRVETASPSGNSMKVTIHNSGNRHRDPATREFVGTRFFAWSYTIEIPGGGVVLTDDLFLFRPPESGYEESFTFEVPEGEEGWISQVEEQKFYFKTADGNYGAFALNVRATATGAMGFRFKKLFFNPTGERNLENF